MLVIDQGAVTRRLSQWIPVFCLNHRLNVLNLTANVPSVSASRKRWYAAPGFGWCLAPTM